MEVQKPNAAKVLSLLKDTTNSYKYLFFFAFFRHLKQFVERIEQGTKCYTGNETEAGEDERC